jgi:hypothetical protein
MIALKPSLKKLRLLAGEGDFHCYRLLKQGRRAFLFSKYLLTTIAYYKGNGESAMARTIAFVKGGNQLRYHQHVAEQLKNEFGVIQLFISSHLSSSTAGLMLPRIPILDMLLQVYFLMLMLMTGKKRYLNLYLLAFEVAIVKSVDIGFKYVEAFVCYNDQPYDVAAIINALHVKKTCRTIVIQHGLILSEKFYFPSNAREFWAWGELSRQHYCAKEALSKILIKGRYSEDSSKKKEYFVLPGRSESIRILVAPSYFHDEVKEILVGLRNVLKSEFSVEVLIAIKYHPATKFIKLLKLWNSRRAPWLTEEIAPMEALAEKYDFLVTKSSTSAVDFLLRGKPVFFLKPQKYENFPSHTYGFELSQLATISTVRKQVFAKKNLAREKFINNALNV